VGPTVTYETISHEFAHLVVSGVKSPEIRDDWYSFQSYVAENIPSLEESDQNEVETLAAQMLLMGRMRLFQDRREWLQDNVTALEIPMLQARVYRAAKYPRVKRLSRAVSPMVRSYAARLQRGE